MDAPLNGPFIAHFRGGISRPEFSSPEPGSLLKHYYVPQDFSLGGGFYCQVNVC